LRKKNNKPECCATHSTNICKNARPDGPIIPTVLFKNAKGLSVLWATANFTASLINLFFVFIYVTIPLYGQISSIYCPILEFALLIQFWIYGRYRKTEKLVYGSVCVLLWGVVIVVELVFKIENFIEYIAILLWCIETFPQVRRIMFYDHKDKKQVN
jgi:hypothetical protein